MRQTYERSLSNRLLKTVAILCGSLFVLGCAPSGVVESNTAEMKSPEQPRTTVGSLAAEPQPQSSRIVQAVNEATEAVSTVATIPVAEAEQVTRQEENATLEKAPPSLARAVIAVCPPAFRIALTPWIERREREGLEVRLIDSQSTAKELKSALVESATERCDYILLVGDSSYTPNDEPLDASVLVPTLYRPAGVTAKYQQSPQLPGDFGYGDFNDDGMVDAAVGRLPVKSSEQLASVIKRIIAYEDSTNFGEWRSRVDLVAGIGGFGPMIDGAIEMVAGGIITGSLPGFVRTRITHASPTSDFHPGMEQFTAKVLQNYREGARFWVYAGHGWVNELDRVPATQFGRPVLSTSDVPELVCEQTASPIALMLACYTGAFDANEDCLAERMMLSDQGPIAVLAGSRVTMPYGNASAAVGLIHAVYHRKAERLGDAWNEALREMATSAQNDAELKSRRVMIDGIASLMGGGSSIDEERREHMQLYNWLGDPTLRLGNEDAIELTSTGDLTMGQPFVIRGRSPIAGKLTVEVHRRLGSPISENANMRDDPENKYRTANETVLCASEQATLSGEWTCTLMIPAAEKTLRLRPSTTPVIVRASVVSETGYAAGAQSAWLRPDAKSEGKQAKSKPLSATDPEND
jgi:hypothetical protein